MAVGLTGSDARLAACADGAAGVGAAGVGAGAAGLGDDRGLVLVTAVRLGPPHRLSPLCSQGVLRVTAEPSVLA